jgi:hypothetical protein
MNKNILYNIIVALCLTLFSAFIVNNYNIEDNMIVFVSGFIMLFVWQYLLNRIKPIRISKDSDEINHPVTENVKILHICNIQKHYGKKYDKKSVETCDCGSILFRIYNEDTEKGTFIQFICAKCNQKATGLEFNWKPKV